MGQLTLTGCYGPKAPPLANLIREISGMVEASTLKKYFTPYPLEQVHGTLIGLERVTGFKECCNAGYWRTTGEKKEMDFSCLMATLSECLPMQARIGGFSESYAGFNSRGTSPYRRSFGIHWASGRITLIGWPYYGSFQSFDFNNQRPLWELRKRLANRCFIRHKYHEHKDNDFYMVLGALYVPKGLNVAALEQLKQTGQQLENRARAFLSCNPISIALDPETVSFVRYKRETLELQSSKAWKARELESGAFDLRQLYH